MGDDQTELWDVGPDARQLARRTDPETSKLSAQETVHDVAGLQSRAADAVARWPGRTGRELTVLLDDTSDRTVGRRLSEIEKKGLVRRGASRPCRVTGRQAATWFPKEGE